MLQLLLNLAGFYDYTLPSPDGSSLPLSRYKGKKVMIINIASASRYSFQLDSLETLYEKYHDNLTIIAVPSNSFLHEPLDDAGIQQLIATHHISFPVTARSVVTGATRLPLYEWLAKKDLNSIVDYAVLGDFQKVLISPEGKIVGMFSGATNPMDIYVQEAVAGH